MNADNEYDQGAKRGQIRARSSDFSVGDITNEANDIDIEDEEAEDLADADKQPGGSADNLGNSSNRSRSSVGPMADNPPTAVGNKSTVFVGNKSARAVGNKSRNATENITDLPDVSEIVLKSVYLSPRQDESRQPNEDKQSSKEDGSFASSPDASSLNIGKKNRGRPRKDASLHHDFSGSTVGTQQHLQFSLSFRLSVYIRYDSVSSSRVLVREILFL